MLKTRIITATILIPLVILGTLFLSSQIFAAVSGLVFLGAMWEWTALAGFKTISRRVFCFILIPLFTLFLLALMQSLGKSVVRESVPLLIMLFWLLVGFSVLCYPKYLSCWQSKSAGVIAGSFVLIPAWFMLVALQYLNPSLVLYVFSLVWVSDIAAYFVGKRFGKHKLAPVLSPGKTWEGVFGAFIAGFFVIILGYMLIDQNLSRWHWVILGLITIGFSIVGDLFESLFKRLRNLKDSGAILPGHGGLLDRIDSLTAAVPVFAIGFMV
jgi:phosphatidate cytidylyltransferase